MTLSLEKQTLQNLDNPEYYCNRELSWLQFNDRVLHEAFDERTPLLERLKFLAIFSTNLDEFFMVRISGLLEQVQAKITKTPVDGLTPQQQLEKIHEHLLPVVQRQHQYFLGEMRSHMEAEGIYLLTYDRLNDQQKSYLAQYFEGHIFLILTPLRVDPAHPFARMSNLSLKNAAWVSVVLADFPLREAEAGDLLFAIQQEISRRRLESFVIRLEVAATFSNSLLESLIQEF